MVWYGMVWYGMVSFHDRQRCSVRYLIHSFRDPIMIRPPPVETRHALSLRQQRDATTTRCDNAIDNYVIVDHIWVGAFGMMQNLTMKINNEKIQQ